MASCLMMGAKIALCLADNFFESFNIGCLKDLGNITAAAVTGPERQPLPASSVPATSNFLL